jgi:hypothetical protein
MPEAVDRLAAAQPVAERRLQRTRLPQRREQRFDAQAQPAVPRAFQRA